MRNILLFSLPLLLGASCGNSARLEVYFVQQGVFQYYIRSSEMGGNTGSVNVDFTFRDRKQADDTVIFNFTIASGDDFRKNMTAAWLTVDGNPVSLKELKLLFRDFSDHVARFTSLIPSADFKTLIQAGDVRFFVVLGGKTNAYTPLSQLKQTFQDASLQILNN